MTSSSDDLRCNTEAEGHAWRAFEGDFTGEWSWPGEDAESSAGSDVDMLGGSLSFSDSASDADTDETELDLSFALLADTQCRRAAAVKVKQECAAEPWKQETQTIRESTGPALPPHPSAAPPDIKNQPPDQEPGRLPCYNEIFPFKLTAPYQLSRHMVFMGGGDSASKTYCYAIAAMPHHHHEICVQATASAGLSELRLIFSGASWPSTQFSVHDRPAMLVMSPAILFGSLDSRQQLIGASCVLQTLAQKSPGHWTLPSVEMEGSRCWIYFCISGWKAGTPGQLGCKIATMEWADPVPLVGKGTEAVGRGTACPLCLQAAPKLKPPGRRFNGMQGGGIKCCPACIAAYKRHHYRIGNSRSAPDCMPEAKCYGCHRMDCFLPGNAVQGGAESQAGQAAVAPAKPKRERDPEVGLSFGGARPAAKVQRLVVALATVVVGLCALFGLVCQVSHGLQLQSLWRIPTAAVG